MAVLNTPPERARLYYKYRPARVLLAADPDAVTHRLFGIPETEMVQNESASRWPLRATPGQFAATSINPTGELPAPASIYAAAEALNHKDAFQLTESDEQTIAAHLTLLTGHFLIDREGIVRWAQVEASERISDVGKYPGDDEILAAARAP